MTLFDGPNTNLGPHLLQDRRHLIVDLAIDDGERDLQAFLKTV
jgi:hypothetical protein